MVLAASMGWVAAPFPLHAQSASFAAGRVDAPRISPVQIAALESPPKRTSWGEVSGTPAVAAQTEEKSQHQIAEEQLKEEEKQRMLGLLPSFNVMYRPHAVSLTAMQKMRLAFRGAIDPSNFATAPLVAGYNEAMHADVGFPWGARGFWERTGAAYLDTFNGSMIGTGILPAVLHQDPRYFRMGHGSMVRRSLYSLANNVACKHDNSGRWEPNYSNIAGNIAAGALSNLYYPSHGSSVGKTFSNGLMVVVTGGMGTLVDEFWPDISRKFLHKDPTHGLDAQPRAADLAAKQAKKDQQ